MGAAALLFAVGCTPELGIPAEARIECAADTGCPPEWRCALPPGRCVLVQHDDVDPPGLAAFSVTPERVTRGRDFEIELTADEPLLADPVVRIAERFEAALVEAAVDGDPLRYRFSHTVGADAEEGPASLDVVLVDLVGNLSTIRAGEVIFDFTPPRVRDLDWDRPETKTAVAVGEQMAFEGRVEAGSTLVSASVVDQDGTVRAVAGAGLATGADPEWLEISGTMVLAGVDLSGATTVAVELVLEDEAGNRTPPGTVRTPALGIRLEPPQAPFLEIQGKPRTGHPDVQLLLSAVHAIEVYVDGDIADTPGVREWTALQSPFPVLLSPGNGPKVIHATFRDAAHQTVGPVSDEIELVVGLISSRPRLVPPDDQTAVKEGDMVGVAGTGELGATVVAARLVDPVDERELLTLPDGAIALDDGVLSGAFEVMGDWVEHGVYVSLEVILEVGGALSAPTDSRSPPLRVDLRAPQAPPSNLLRVLERHPAPFDPSALDPEPFTYRLESEPGALLGARWAEVYADADLETPIARVDALEDADFVPVVLPPPVDRRYHVVAVDGAGNRSPPTELVLPTLTVTAIEPAPTVRADGTVNIYITSDTALNAAPQVQVGPADCEDPDTGTDATYLSGSWSTPGASLRYWYRPQGAGCEGDRATVVRVVAEPSYLLFAPDTEVSVGVPFTHDRTPPTLDLSKVRLVQNPPGEIDRLEADPGAVSDQAGDDLLDLTRHPVTVEVLDAGGARIGPVLTALADGSFPPADIGDNLHETVSIRLTDLAGNVTVEAVPEINDIHPPFLEGLVADPVWRSAGGPLTITFTAGDDEGGLGEVEVSVAGVPAVRVSGDPTAEPGVAEAFVFTWQPDPGRDAEGDQGVVVDVRDRAGNAAAGAAGIVLDFMPPEVSIVHPGDRPEWSPGARVEGFASDALTGVAAVQVAVSSTATGLFWDGEAFDADAPAWHLAEGTTGWSWLDPAVDYGAGGAFRFHVRALDGAGNASEPVVADVSVDPDLPLPPAGTGAHALGEARVRLTWDAPTDPSITCVHVHYAHEAGPPYDGTGADQGDSPIALCAGETTLDVTGLPRGCYVWTLTAVDDTGAESPYGPQHQAASQGWRWVGTALGGQGMRQVLALGEGRFVAVGDEGFVWVSHDGGEQWTAARPSERHFAAAHADGDVVVAVSRDGIVRSDDGGLTWSRPEQPEVGGLDGVWGEGGRFVAVGSGSIETIVRSVDGGESWTLIDGPDGFGLNAVWGAGDLVVAGPGWSQFPVSLDGGQTWAHVSHGPSNQQIDSIHGDGTSVYFGTIGDNFSRRVYEVRVDPDDGLVVTLLPLLPSGVDATSLWAAPDALIAADRGSGGRMHRLPHGASAWESYFSSTTRFNDVWGDDGLAIAVGRTPDDRIGRYLDGAASLVPHGTRAVLNSVIGEGDVVVATGHAGALVRSTDRGASFSVVHPPYTHGGSVWSAGSEVLTLRSVSASSSASVLRRSVDFGRTWTVVSESLDIQGARFWGEGPHRVGVGAGYSPNTDRARVLVSNDGGASFELLPLEGARALRAVWGRGDTVIATVNGGAILRSLDGGRMWEEVAEEPADPLNAPIYLAGTGVSVVLLNSFGAAGRRSADGGETWTDFEPPFSSTHSLWAGDGRFVAAGTGGFWLSTDGGASWTQTQAQANPTGVLRTGDRLWGLSRGFTSTRLHRSDDDGETWTLVQSWSGMIPAGMGAMGDLVIVVSRVLQDPSQCCLTTGETVARISIDAGETFDLIGPIDPFAPGQFTQVHMLADGSVLGLGAPTVVHLRD